MSAQQERDEREDEGLPGDDGPYHEMLFQTYAPPPPTLGERFNRFMWIVFASLCVGVVFWLMCVFAWDTILSATHLR